MLDNKNNSAESCVIPRWQRIKATLNNLNYEEFVRKAKADKEAVILDVRTPEEFDGVIIDGALNVDYLRSDLADLLEGLNPENNYYIYCRTGRRSLRVCVIMRNLGIKNIYNLEGGIVSK